MARASKRDQIVKQATLLFLENGFKGTSIDLVVASCEVSKPTVYNHFPDKTQLMQAVMAHWLVEHPAREVSVQGEAALANFLASTWFAPPAIAMYRIVIGEGWRFPDASEVFWSEYEGKWRQQLTLWAEKRRYDTAALERLHAEVSHQCWCALHPQAGKMRPDISSLLTKLASG